MLRDVFLIAQQPLLGEEGKIRHTAIWETAPYGRGYTLTALRAYLLPSSVTVQTKKGAPKAPLLKVK